MIRRRLDALASRVSAWTKRHNLVTHIIITTLIVAPGYARIEGIVQDIIDTRTAGRVVSCEDSRETATSFNAAIHLVFHPANARPRTPAEQAQADMLEKALLLPVRVCTPAAIDKHLKNQAP